MKMNNIIMKNLESTFEEIKLSLNTLIMDKLSIDIDDHKEIFSEIDELFQTKFNVIVKKINSCKRPLNPYFIFWREKRPDVVKEFPHLIPKNVTKKLSELWKNLEESEKDIYRNKAKILKKEFNQNKEDLSTDSSTKKKRGRPKGSKNKKKTTSTKNSSVISPQLTIIKKNVNGDNLLSDDEELDFDM